MFFREEIYVQKKVGREVWGGIIGLRLGLELRFRLRFRFRLPAFPYYMTTSRQTILVLEEDLWPPYKSEEADDE